MTGLSVRFDVLLDTDGKADHDAQCPTPCIDVFLNHVTNYHPKHSLFISVRVNVSI